MTGEEVPVPYGYTDRWRGPDAYHVRQIAPADLRPMRLGLIGLGGVAQAKHLPALQRLQTMGEPVTVACGADIDETVGAKVARQNGLHLYLDHRQMLDNEQLDAVEVLIRPEAPRGDVIADCLERGLPVLAEKPLVDYGFTRLAESLSEAARLCKLAADTATPLMTGFVKRFAPPYANAKALLASGAIGAPAMIAAKMCMAWGGAKFLEQSACHILDLLRFFMGDIRSLSAYGTQRYKKAEYTFDNAVISISFVSGAVGTLHVSSTALSLHPWERVEIYGENAWLAVDDSSILTLHDREASPAKVWQPVWPHTLMFDEEFSGFCGEIKTFLDAARSRTPADPSGNDGYRALETALAIHRSVTTGKEVVLPLQPIPAQRS